MKRLISFCITLIVIIAVFPVSAMVAAPEYLEVVVDDTPIMESASEKGNVLSNCPIGRVFIMKQSGVDCKFRV